MSDYTKPLPRGEDLNGEFYQFCKQHELRFQRCQDCGAWRHELTSAGRLPISGHLRRARASKPIVRNRGRCRVSILVACASCAPTSSGDVVS